MSQAANLALESTDVKPPVQCREVVHAMEILYRRVLSRTPLAPEVAAPQLLEALRKPLAPVALHLAHRQIDDRLLVELPALRHVARLWQRRGPRRARRAAATGRRRRRHCRHRHDPDHVQKS